MVMDQFVTTHRADFVWPYVVTIGVKPNEPQFGDNIDPSKQSPCPCHCTQAPYVTEDRKLLGPKVVEDQSWSRLGPMGPLLDPKLYPARVGPAPEFETSRYNQPNVFLKKLQEKYPFLYEVLKTAPPADMLSRINKDRLRTTYQVDFCHLHEYPNAPYDELLRSAGIQGVGPCKEPKTLPGDPCRDLAKDTSYRRGGPSGSKDFPAGRGKNSAFATGKSETSGSGGSGGAGRSGGGGGGGGGGGSKIGGSSAEEKCDVGLNISSNTEYRDVYNNLGDMIIKDKVHYRKCTDDD